MSYYYESSRPSHAGASSGRRSHHRRDEDDRRAGAASFGPTVSEVLAAGPDLASGSSDNAYVSGLEIRWLPEDAEGEPCQILHNDQGELVPRASEEGRWLYPLVIDILDRALLMHERDVRHGGAGALTRIARRYVDGMEAECMPHNYPADDVRHMKDMRLLLSQLFNTLRGCFCTVYLINITYGYAMTTALVDWPEPRTMANHRPKYTSAMCLNYNVLREIDSYTPGTDPWCMWMFDSVVTVAHELVHVVSHLLGGYYPPGNGIAGARTICPPTMAVGGADPEEGLAWETEALGGLLATYARDRDDLEHYVADDNYGDSRSRRISFAWIRKCMTNDEKVFRFPVKFSEKARPTTKKELWAKKSLHRNILVLIKDWSEPSRPSTSSSTSSSGGGGGGGAAAAPDFASDPRFATAPGPSTSPPPPPDQSYADPSYGYPAQPDARYDTQPGAADPAYDPYAHYNASQYPSHAAYPAETYPAGSAYTYSMAPESVHVGGGANEPVVVDVRPSDRTYHTSTSHRHYTTTTVHPPPSHSEDPLVEISDLRGELHGERSRIRPEDYHPHAKRSEHHTARAAAAAAEAGQTTTQLPLRQHKRGSREHHHHQHHRSAESRKHHGDGGSSSRRDKAPALDAEYDSEAEREQRRRRRREREERAEEKAVKEAAAKKKLVRALFGLKPQKE